MRKLILMICCAVFLGMISGKLLFSKFQDTSSVFSEREDVYFLQEGVYSSMDSLSSNTKEISPKIVLKEDDKYYVYVGISKDLDVIEKLKKIYQEKGYSTYQKSVRVGNLEFLSNIDQYDILSKTASNDHDLLTIQEVILSNYEEVSKG